MLAVQKNSGEMFLVVGYLPERVFFKKLEDANDGLGFDHLSRDDFDKEYGLQQSSRDIVIWGILSLEDSIKSQFEAQKILLKKGFEHCVEIHEEGTVALTTLPMWTDLKRGLEIGEWDSVRDMGYNIIQITKLPEMKPYLHHYARM